jgi:hypothetical protein
VSYSFADEFAVAAGAGTNKVGLQLALAVRVRLFPLDRNPYTLPKLARHRRCQLLLDSPIGGERASRREQTGEAGYLAPNTLLTVARNSSRSSSVKLLGE